MGFIKYASDVSAPITVAFAYAGDPRYIPDWMSGAAEVTERGDRTIGLDTQVGIGLQLGLWHPVLHCAVTEYRQDAVVGYTLTGGPLDARLTLRFDPLGRGRSVLTSELDYAGPRGIATGLRDRPRNAVLRAALRRSEARLRRAIEELHGTDLVGRLA